VMRTADHRLSQTEALKLVAQTVGELGFEA
jgi:hypothetical protein